MRRRPTKHLRHLKDKVVLINKDVSRREELPASINAGGLREGVNGIAAPAAQFPDPKFRLEANGGLWQQLRRRFIPRRRFVPKHHKATMFNGMATAEYEMWHKVSIDPETGEGVLRWKSWRNDGWISHPLKPGTEINLQVSCGADLPLVNLSNGKIRCPDFNRMNLQGATLDDIDLHFVSMSEINLNGASLRNVKFPSCDVIGAVTMMGADVSGADFSQVVLRSSRHHRTINKDSEPYIDFTDSNATREQIEQLEGNLANFPTLPIRYRQYSLDEIAALTGSSKEELGVLIWAGGVEARDNASCRTVSSFDADTCHIPQWEIQSLLGMI
jgi:hypothetical protein